jgi:hypothetical protein
MEGISIFCLDPQGIDANKMPFQHIPLNTDEVEVRMGRNQEAYLPFSRNCALDDRLVDVAQNSKTKSTHAYTSYECRIIGQGMIVLPELRRITCSLIDLCSSPQTTSLSSS